MVLKYRRALYIQALAEMQQMDPIDITSYFQIAGNVLWSGITLLQFIF
jgi:hypothetical protein